jgi:hypothetical protein
MNKEIIKGVFQIIRTVADIIEEMVIAKANTDVYFAVAGTELAEGTMVRYKDGKVVSAEPTGAVVQDPVIKNLAENVKAAVVMTPPLYDPRQNAVTPPVAAGSVTVTAPTGISVEKKERTPEQEAKMRATLEKARATQAAKRAASLASQGLPVTTATVPAKTGVSVSLALPPAPVTPAKRTRKKSGNGDVPIQHQLILKAFEGAPRPIETIMAKAQQLFAVEDILDFSKFWNEFTKSGKDMFSPYGYTPQKSVGPDGVALFCAVNNNPDKGSFFS